jgi:hypothetical protein
MRRTRLAMAGLMVVAGPFVAARGILYSLEQGLGWWQVVAPAGVGALMVALGAARWRYWRAGRGR